MIDNAWSLSELVLSTIEQGSMVRMCTVCINYITNSINVLGVDPGFLCVSGGGGGDSNQTLLFLPYNFHIGVGVSSLYITSWGGGAHPFIMHNAIQYSHNLLAGGGGGCHMPPPPPPPIRQWMISSMVLEAGVGVDNENWALTSTLTYYQFKNLTGLKG